jgi:ATP-dependent RNA helicase DDX49/DBP8
MLSMDPFGVFAVILTPTRELAIQISEQICALGAGLSVSVALVIGGVDLIAQRLALSKRPHFIIATPGRLRHHFESADPPSVSKVRYLVLDEADRLLSLGFSEELEAMLSKLSPKRSTLLFSATLTSTLEDLEKLAMQNAVRFDLTKGHKMPVTAKQYYLLMPARVKLCFLVALLRKLMKLPDGGEEQQPVGKRSDQAAKSRKALVSSKGKSSREAPPSSFSSQSQSQQQSQQQSLIILFVQSCHKCHEISLTLQSMGIECAALHSVLSQSSRMQSLQRFKSLAVRVLVATDVASRGLDIPAVDTVINFDLPRVAADYVHRVGRTARIGRAGDAISFVTQHDIAVLHAIEQRVDTKMAQYEGVQNEDIVPLLKPLSKAMQLVQMQLLSSGVLEREALVKKRKRRQREQQQQREQHE